MKNGTTHFSGIYLNGTLIAQQTASTADLAGLTSLLIAEDFVGRIDDVAVLSTALTSMQRTQLWNTRNGQGILTADNTLVKNGGGTLTLSGSGITYTGATTVSGGTLKLSDTTGFASSIGNNATVELNATAP